MKTLQDNYMIDGFMGIDYATAPSYFATGKAAMLADGSWDAPTVATNPELKFGYFRFRLRKMRPRIPPLSASMT